MGGDIICTNLDRLHRIPLQQLIWRREEGVRQSTLSAFVVSWYNTFLCVLILYRRNSEFICLIAFYCFKIKFIRGNDEIVYLTTTKESLRVVPGIASRCDANPSFSFVRKLARSLWYCLSAWYCIDRICRCRISCSRSSFSRLMFASYTHESWVTKTISSSSSSDLDSLETFYDTSFTKDPKNYPKAFESTSTSAYLKILGDIRLVFQSTFVFRSPLFVIPHISVAVLAVVLLPRDPVLRHLSS